MSDAAGERLADFVHDLRLADVPAAARRAALGQLLDGLGCGLAAARLGEAHAVRATVDFLGGNPQATRLDGRKGTVTGAALVNGVLIHCLDYDDTHPGALVHATSVTLPPALAVGELTGARGSEVLTAALAGYEVVTRLGLAVPHGFHRRGLHATAVCGTLSSALVAGRLLGLTRGQLAAALGVAGSMAAGSLEFLSDGSSTKQLHPGFASQAGILAALLAQGGASGPATILEGPNGVYRALADVVPDAKDITADLGVRWEVERISTKPLPLCQLSIASLEAVAILRVRLDGRSVEHLTVAVPAETIPIVLEPADSKRRPRSTYEAKFSLPWCIAALLLDGAITVDTFTPANIARADIPGLAARISYSIKAWDGPAATAPGSVMARLADGSTARIDLVESVGVPSVDFIEAALRAKFIANCGSVYDAERVASRVLGLGELDHLTDLTETFRPAAEVVG